MRPATMESENAIPFLQTLGIHLTVKSVKDMR
jgi:hypothetical protein